MWEYVHMTNYSWISSLFRVQILKQRHWDSKRPHPRLLSNRFTQWLHCVSFSADVVQTSSLALSFYCRNQQSVCRLPSTIDWVGSPAPNQSFYWVNSLGKCPCEMLQLINWSLNSPPFMEPRNSLPWYLLTFRNKLFLYGKLLRPNRQAGCPRLVES